MKKKIIVSVIYLNQFNQNVKDSVTILANNLFTDGKLNALGKEKLSKAICGLWSHCGAREPLYVEFEDSKYDEASKDYIASKTQKKFETTPEERLLVMIFKELSPSMINNLNMMNASIEESLTEINLEEEKGDNE